MAVGLRLRDVEELVHVGPALAAVDGREEQARQQEGAAHGSREAVRLRPLHAAAATAPAGKEPPFREGEGRARGGGAWRRGAAAEAVCRAAVSAGLLRRRPGRAGRAGGRDPVRAAASVVAAAAAGRGKVRGAAGGRRGPLAAAQAARVGLPLQPGLRAAEERSLVGR